MNTSRPRRLFTLVQRELREHRRAFFWTPLVIALLLGAAMLPSVLVVDRSSVFDDTLIEVIEEQAAGEGTKVIARGLNPLLDTLHNALLLVLLIALARYLLATLYDDRRDRSILFWRSLPVSEWDTVLSKLGTALIVAPAILIAISVVLQLATLLIAMLVVWRLDMQPLAVLAENLAPGRLLLDRIGAWLLTALWLAPSCAWLLLSSAAARRSPFLFAVTPVIAAILLETLFFKTGYILHAVGRHLPHLAASDDGVGFYLFGPDWMSVDWTALLAGLVFAAAAIALAVYLRRYRWEI